MKTIWVYKNIQKDNSFEFNILLLISSVSLFKKSHPTFKCTLYCDSSVLDILSKKNALKYWDDIIPLSVNPNINPDIFWAYPKLQVLKEQTTPCIILDHDSFIYKPLHDYLQNKIIVSHLELGKGYYPRNNDQFIKKLSYKAYWPTDSVNVSFLYFPNPKFLKLYSSMSLSIMEEFSQMGAPNSQYLIFAEQLLLKYLLDREKLEYSSLISNYWDCRNHKWGETHSKGIWPHPESNLYYYHYGPTKNKIFNNKEKLEKEIEHLHKCQF